MQSVKQNKLTISNFKSIIYFICNKIKNSFNYKLKVDCNNNYSYIVNKETIKSCSTTFSLHLKLLQK